MGVRLIYAHDGEEHVVELAGDRLVIGRAADADVRVPLSSVSRRHARLERVDGVWTLSDLGSSNGTFVGDRAADRTPLASGATVRLGRFELRFEDDDGPAVEASVVDLTDGEAPSIVQQTVDFESLARSADTTARLQELLSVLSEGSKLMLFSTDLDTLFERVLGLVFEHLDVERAAVMLWDEDRSEVVPRSVRWAEHVDRDRIRFSRTVARKVCTERVAVLTSDVALDEDLAGAESLVHEGIRSVMAAPLWRDDGVEGLLYVDSADRAGAFDRADLDLLSALGNQLAVAIQRERLENTLSEQRIVRRRLERYHSPAVVERIATLEDAAARLVVEEREVSVLFADMVGFTSRSESMEPREVADLLNGYFAAMAESIFRFEGTLDKFIGDCVMAVFGAPLEATGHAGQAVRAALDMRDALRDLGVGEGDGVFPFRVGIHSGRVVAGDIGSPNRRDYSVLGATVNLASRIESSVATAGQVVISEATRAGLDPRFRLRSLGRHQPRGTSSPIECFEVLGLEDTTRPPDG